MRKGPVFLILLTVVLTVFPCSAVEVEQGRISGTVVIEGSGPVADGTVMFFSGDIGPPPDIYRYMRTPEYIAVTDSSGKFSVSLPAGTYYIGVMKRLSAKWGGPPRGDDLFLISMDEGGARAFLVEKAGSTDTGILSFIPGEEKKHHGEGLTALEGTVMDMNGNPVEDVVVFGYATPAAGSGLAFVSDYTGEDGRYLLRVHEGGTYYLMVMGQFGSLFPGSGMTVRDEGEGAASGLRVNTGDIKKNIEIKISLPPGY